MMKHGEFGGVGGLTMRRRLRLSKRASLRSRARGEPREIGIVCGELLQGFVGYSNRLKLVPDERGTTKGV
jgi:hypothetical protein